MPYSVEDKLVIALASSALFDLTESDRVFRTKGEDAYRLYQRKNERKILKQGVAFPFIRRLLNINGPEDQFKLVEVLLLSRNDPDTGLRVFNSIEHYKLDISRAAFTCGQQPFKYMPAFNAKLFLSANKSDVQEAVAMHFPAGQVIGSFLKDDDGDPELRIAFDFDGVLVSDEAESVFQKKGLKHFHKYEKQFARKPHHEGPLFKLVSDIAKLQRLEREYRRTHPSYKPRIRTAIITARNAPAHKRMVTTLRKWGFSFDETFFLGGLDKKAILSIFKPHIFFDDQSQHLMPSADIVPCVHVPFGIKNTMQPKAKVKS